MPIKDAGESYNLSNDKNILKINSPANAIEGPFDVVYKDIKERWAIVTLLWNSKPHLGIRWFWGSMGEPNSRGCSTWFIIPQNITLSILGGLPLDVEKYNEIINFLSAKQ